MKIELTDHAEYRLLERNIDLSRIRKIINSPSKAISAGDGLIKKKDKLDDGKILEVIYKQLTKNKFLICTAYYEN